MNNTADFQDNSTSSIVLQDTPYRPGTGAKYLYNCELFKFYVNGILNTVIITFGLVSNIFTVITLWDERKTNGTSFLLICLALADNFVLLVGSVNTVFFGYVVIIFVVVHGRYSNFNLVLKEKVILLQWASNPGPLVQHDLALYYIGKC